MEALQGLSRFEIVRRLGAGGMGVVYEAIDRSCGARVALKTLHEIDAHTLYRFKQEFRALADISHPNLVGLYELVADGSRWLISMEYVEAEDLLSCLRRRFWASAGAGGETPTDRDPATTDATVATVALGSGAPTLDTATTDQRAASGDGSIGEPAMPEPDAQQSVIDCDFTLLRHLFCQLAAAVAALHAAGKLHRDLKPSNVLVQPDGRVVVVDFGLVAELRPGLDVERARAWAGAEGAAEPASPARTYQSTDHLLMGTAAYMSPEQAAVQPLTPASDVYALGIMLFQALTGRLPFYGSVRRMLWRKQHEDAPAPSTLCSGVPPDLDALCCDLLARDPARRPTALHLLARLGGAEATGDRAATSEAAPALPFIGRERHIDLLHRAYAEVAGGHLVVCAIHGRSGSGKSTLTAQLLDEIAGRNEAVILSGRCFEQESVPYKALDSLIDALARHLLALPHESVQGMVPVGIGVLARLFPVLRRVPALEVAVEQEGEVLEPAVARRRAAAALKELLRRLGQRQPLVLLIDDLQWGDEDSAVLLVTLLEPAEAPRALLLLCYRSEHAATSPCLRALLAREQGRAPVREVVVGALSPDETRALAVALLAQKRVAPAQPDPESLISSVIAQSGGNPFFVYELAHHASLGRSRPEVGLGLDAILWQRISLLPDGARRLLEVLAVSGQPLPLRLILAAAGLSAVSPAMLFILRHGRLIRAAAQAADGGIETYHDRIRESVVSHLDPETLRQTHLGLATALASEPDADPEVVASHFVGGGAPHRAAGPYLRAAEQALAVLAFERAERLLKLAATCSSDAAERAEIGEKMVHFYTDQARFAEAYAVGREEVARFGVELPARFAPPLLLREIVQVQLRLRGRRPAELIDLPTLHDLRLAAAVRLLSAMAKASYQIEPGLCILVSARGVNLCLQHGNIPECAVSYMALGVIFFGGILGMHQMGYEFGQLALALNRKYDFAAQRAEVHFVVGYFGTSWLRPARDAEALWQTSFASGMASRDWFHTGCAALATVMSQLLRGVPLPEVESAAGRYLMQLRPLHLREAIGIVTLGRQVARSLQGRTAGLTQLGDAELDEQALAAEVGAYGSRHFAHFYFVCKMQLAYLDGQIDEAQRLSALSAQYLGDARGLLQGAEHHFYDALITAAALPRAGLGQRLDGWRRIASTWLRLRRWAGACAVNFRARERIVAGELARLRGRPDQALAALAEAAAVAGEHGQLHLQALADRLAAPVAAAAIGAGQGATLASRAAATYRQWGATAVAAQMETARGRVS